MNLLQSKNSFVLNLWNNTMSKEHHMTSVKAHTNLTLSTLVDWKPLNSYFYTVITCDISLCLNRRNRSAEREMQSCLKFITCWERAGLVALVCDV